MAFYDFVRAADDIADHSALTPEDKLERLDLFERALLGDRNACDCLPKAEILRQSLASTGVSERHALDVLKAFKQDATKTRYDDWPDLLDYCAHSASPVGRFLIDLHGESAELYKLSDPLCDALQVLNHLQDCRDDFLNLDRVYLPLDGFRAAGIEVEALGQPASGKAMRAVLDRVLDSTDDLLSRAAPLAGCMNGFRLAAETAVIHEMAVTLSSKLKRSDPLAERVELSKPRFLCSALLGLGRLLWRRRSGPARKRFERSGVAR